MLGDCYTHMRQLDKAKMVTISIYDLSNALCYNLYIQAYSTVLSHDKKHIMAMHNLAVVMGEQKQYAEAVKLFSTVLQLDPEHKTGNAYQK